MDSNQVITAMILVCLGIMALIMIAGPIKAAAKFFLNAALGGAGFYIANLLLSPLQIFVGINFLTMGIVGVLGLPGFAAAILISAIL